MKTTVNKIVPHEDMAYVEFPDESHGTAPVAYVVVFIEKQLILFSISESCIAFLARIRQSELKLTDSEVAPPSDGHLFGFQKMEFNKDRIFHKLSFGLAGARTLADLLDDGK